MTSTTPTVSTTKDSLQLSKAVDDWRQDFLSDVHTLAQLLTLRTRPDDYTSRDALEPMLSRIASRLSKLEHATDQLRRQLQAERTRIPQLKQFHSLVQTQKERVSQIHSHLPKDLKPIFATKPPPPSIVKNNTRNGITSKNVEDYENEEEEEEEEEEDQRVTNNTRKMSDAPHHQQRNTRRPPTKAPTPTAASGRPPKQKSHNCAPSRGGTTKQQQPSVTKKSSTSSATEVIVRPISKEELAAAPQYVRGRMTVEKIEAVSTRLSKIATAKYGLLRRANSSLSPTEMSQCQDFQKVESECDISRGTKFLSDDDIKVFGQYRIDSTVKSAINLLRHVGVLKEVRAKNSLRVLIINDSF